MKIFYEAFNGGNDGRDCSSLGYFETRELAIKAAEGQGTFGVGDGTIVEHEMFTEQDAKQEAEDEQVLKTLTEKHLAALKRRGLPS